MAQFIPPTFDPQKTPPGERRVFRDLQNCPGTEDWKILHSFDLPDHIRQAEGEIDFLVLIPGLGLICLEVKSHDRIARNENGTWELGTKVETRGPFKQSSEAMHSLRNSKLKNIKRGIPMISAVAFTEVIFDQPAVEWEPWQVIDSRNFGGTNLRDALLAICHAMRTKFAQIPNAKWFDPNSTEPTTESVNQIIQALRPHFEIFQTPVQRLAEIESEILEFTEQQFSVLNMMEFNQSVLVVGPAGTGKTVLAIESVRRAMNQGKRVLYLCFNRRLAQSVAYSIGQHQSVEVKTFHSFLEQICGERIGSRNPKEYFDSYLPQRALEILAGQDFEKFDVLVVDEFQDLAKDVFLKVLRKLVDIDKVESREFFFGDFQEQTIFGSGSDARRIIRTLAVDLPVLNLTKNCRNRPELEFPLSLQGFDVYSEYLRPTGGKFKSFDELSSDYIPSIASFIRNLVGQYTAEQVKILVPSNLDKQSEILTRIFSSIGNSSDLRPEVVGIYEYKGLECRAAVLIGLRNLTLSRNRMLYYIAATRATEQFVVSVSEELRDAFV
jgi:hypothetical protein